MTTDLFGQEIPDPRDGAEDAADRVTNNIDDVVAVLRIGHREGYTVVGARHQVWRRVGKSSVEPAPRHEADVVRQLLGSGWLTVGGLHTYTHESLDVACRAVLLPKRTRDWLHRWDSRKRLGTPGGGR